MTDQLASVFFVKSFDRKMHELRLFSEFTEICPKEMFIDYFLGNLELAQVLSIEDHIVKCPPCRRALAIAGVIVYKHLNNLN